MKPDSAFGKLHKLQTLHANDLGILMNPRLPKMPLPMQKYDDPFLPFGKAIVDATRDLVSAYIFDLAAYLALGAAGAVALERTMAYVGASVLKVLHGPFVGGAYVAAAQAFNADAVTVSHDRDAEAYHAAGLGAFLLEDCRLNVVGGAASVRLLGEEFLYAGRGEDFAQRVRDAVQVARR